jgi:hypothetical protein
MVWPKPPSLLRCHKAPCLPVDNDVLRITTLPALCTGARLAPMMAAATRCLLSLPLALLAGRVELCDAVVVGAAVVPHGDFALDPTLVQRANGSQQVHDACLKASRLLQAMRPDRLVISTPHGIELSRDLAVYLNSKASGYAMIGKGFVNERKQTFPPPPPPNTAKCCNLRFAAGEDLHNSSFKPCGSA